MRTMTKIWYGIGACAVMSGAASAETAGPPAAATIAATAMQALGGAPGETGNEAGAETGTDDFPGGFDRALEKVLAGEGGEGGRGFTKMLPSVTSPALHAFQVRKALTGNTLYASGGSALHYDKSGTLSGWMGSWAVISPGACPAGVKLGEDHFNGSKGCYKLTKYPASGSWAMQGDQICRSITANGKTDKSCSYVALLLDSFALFDGEKGTMSGKGYKLLAGKQVG